MARSISMLLLCCVLWAAPLVLGDQEDPYAGSRRSMVKRQLKARGINDTAVLEAMDTVPRHLFVLPRMKSQAYRDSALPIDEGQTISQPYIVALMTQCLKLKPGDRVLEIGTGSGYQASVLYQITDQVFTIEIKEKLAKQSAGLFKKLGYTNIRSKWADGYYGWKEEAPFDAVIITCAANHIPRPLVDQLKEGGRLILPLGSTLYYQTLTLITKTKGQPLVEYISDVRFVPMTGEAQRRKGP